MNVTYFKKNTEWKGYKLGSCDKLTFGNYKNKKFVFLVVSPSNLHPSKYDNIVQQYIDDEAKEWFAWFALLTIVVSLGMDHEVVSTSSLSYGWWKNEK